VTLKDHDEVEYSVTLHHESVRAMHQGGGGSGGGGKEPGGSGGVKEPSARRIVRTKAGELLQTSITLTLNLLFSPPSSDLGLNICSHLPSCPLAGLTDVRAIKNKDSTDAVSHPPPLHVVCKNERYP